MDPRRRIDEKHERLRMSEIPFVQTYTEIVLVEQPLGGPIEDEVIVIRIGKSKLKLYAFLTLFSLFLMILGAFQS